jgi:precorrin-6Y C5,15-methyltransferase (decarboxylating)
MPKLSKETLHKKKQFKKPVAVIGLGMSKNDLTQEQLHIIQNADILVGGKRHLSHFEEILSKKIVIDRGMDTIFEEILSDSTEKTIVFLASGDALFFGIGERLKRSIGDENIIFYPNITSVAAAFSRLKKSWQDIKVVSLHGRGDPINVLEYLREREQVAVFTSPGQTPADLAIYLNANDMKEIQFWVFEQMGSSDERFDCYDLDHAATLEFKEPNLVVLLHNAIDLSKSQFHLGMPDACFVHENGLITKSEVRVISLSKLALKSNHVLWDLGAGCGSVAIEASKLVPGINVYAVEKNEKRITQIQENKIRFQAECLNIIPATLPEGLSYLPDPDRVFIGGGGKDLEEIIKVAILRLKPAGIMVINTVLLSSIHTAYEILNQLDFKPSLTQVQINESKIIAGSIRMNAQNPVWIVSGQKGIVS